jgi:hypothetical protein
MKKFNRDVFITALFIWIILTAGSMFFLLRLYSLLKFPILIIFAKFIPDNFVYYIIGLIINAVFYAVIIERIYSLFKKKPKIPPVPTRI